jgi:hypothetical protein
VAWSWSRNGAVAPVLENAEAGHVVATIPRPTKNGVAVATIFVIVESSGESSARKRQSRTENDINDINSSNGTDGTSSHSSGPAPFPFVVDMATGIITVTAGARLDYEATPWVNFTVRAVEADPVDPSVSPYVVEAPVAIPIGPVMCVNGITWSVSGTTPCDDVSQCSHGFELMPPTVSSDRECVFAGTDEITNAKGKVRLFTGVVVIVLILAVALVFICVCWRRGKSESYDPKERRFTKYDVNSGAYPTLAVGGTISEHAEPGARMHHTQLVDAHAPIFIRSTAAHRRSSSEVTYDLLAGIMRGFGTNGLPQGKADFANMQTGGAPTDSRPPTALTHDIASQYGGNDEDGTGGRGRGVGGDGGRANRRETIYDLAANVLSFTGETQSEKPGGDGGRANRRETIYDLAANVLSFTGETQSEKPGGDGGRANRRETIYDLAANVLSDTNETLREFEEPVFDNTKSVSAREGAPADSDEPIFDVGAAADAGDTAEPVVHSFGGADDEWNNALRERLGGRRPAHTPPALRRRSAAVVRVEEDETASITDVGYDQCGDDRQEGARRPRKATMW